MQVSLLQAAIFYAWNMDGMNKNDSSGIIGSGYIMANSILPILKAPDEKSALLFKENTEFIVEGNHMKDGAVAVFDSFSLAISGMTNLDCSLIVELHAYNFCIHDRPQPSISSTQYTSENKETQHIAFEVREYN